MSNLGLAEGIIIGAARSASARARGEPGKVFDWDKAARRIREEQAFEASAGLSGDWNYTGGCIWSEGKPDTDSYTYLGSAWATPELDLDGNVEDCYITEAEATKRGWDAHTKWPESALAILRDVSE
jgi:hypothetical protein